MSTPPIPSLTSNSASESSSGDSIGASGGGNKTFIFGGNPNRIKALNLLQDPFFIGAVALVSYFIFVKKGK